MERKGGRVRGKVLFNKGLCTSAAHKNGGIKRQRGAAARKGLGFRQRDQKFRLQVRRKSVLFRYPSLNLELRWLTPGTDP